jgi:hypothetical protein
LAGGDAIHVRHAHIHQDASGVFGFELTYSRFPTRRFDHSIVLGLERRPCERSILQVVINNEDRGAQNATYLPENGLPRNITLGSKANR